MFKGGCSNEECCPKGGTKRRGDIVSTQTRSLCGCRPPPPVEARACAEHLEAQDTHLEKSRGGWWGALNSEVKALGSLETGIPTPFFFFPPL